MDSTQDQNSIELGTIPDYGSINKEDSCSEDKNIYLPELHSLQPPSVDSSVTIPENRLTSKRCRTAFLVLFAMSSTYSAESISLFSSFYPILAEDKGSSAFLQGFVLGSSGVIIFLATPFIGKYVKSIGLKQSLAYGMFAIGTCNILSGFLNLLPAGATFITMSTALQVAHAMGNAAAVTASFAIMGTEYPDSVAKVFGFTRLSLQFGYILGPIISGTLNQMGGFRLPYLTLGCFHYVIAILTIRICPVYKETASEITTGDKQRVTISRILRIPGVWVAFSCFVVSTFTNGFLMLIIKPQVAKQFVLAPAVIGSLFTMKDCFGGILSPVWGYFGDKMKSLKPFIAVCAATSAVAFLMIDEPSNTTLEPALWIVVGGLILNAIGTSGEQVLSMVDSIRHIIAEGYPNNPEIHGCLAGLWCSLCGLGKFLARSLSGILVDYFGHSTATTLVSGLNLLLALVPVLYLCGYYEESRAKNRATNKECQPLLLSRHKAPQHHSGEIYTMV